MKRLRYWLKYKIWHIYQFQGTNRASRVKRQSRVKKFTTAFSSYRNVTFLSAKYIRKRKFSPVDLNGIRSLLLYWEYFFFFYRDIEIALKAIAREYPSSFLTAVSVKKVRKISLKRKWHKKIYFDINWFDIVIIRWNRKE